MRGGILGEAWLGVSIWVRGPGAWMMLGMGDSLGRCCTSDVRADQEAGGGWVEIQS